MSSTDDIRKEAERILRQNWREGAAADGTPFAYTCPSPGHYPWQFYWDSCFTAIAWRHVDPARSRRELESLLAAGQPDGFIGHTIFWNEPLSGIRRFTYNVVTPDAPMTASIQPPLLAWAWRIAVGDPSEVPAIARQLDWFEQHRDLDGDGLIWIVQPDESGLDASPQFDAIWRHRAHSRPGFLLLVRRNRRLGYDARAIEADGGPVCCEVMTNVLHSLARSSLGRSSLTAQIVERLYDERTGLFRPLARPAPAREPALTWTALSPLALPDLPDEIGHQLVERHLLDPDRFWLPVAPPSVSATDPAFSLRDRSFLRARLYWRGPTWVNATWLVWMGLARLGYAEQARTLCERLTGTVAREGLREYYDPFTGRGMGATDFGWSSLILELALNDPRAADSYLPGAAGQYADAVRQWTTRPNTSTS
jgi:hypothetical protein